MGEKPIEETAGEERRERGNTFNGLPLNISNKLKKINRSWGGGYKKGGPY